MTDTMNAHALLIGVGRCRHAEWSLPVAARDVLGLHKTLADPTLCAYPAERIRVLINEGASREGILAAVKDLAGHAANDPDATFLIYYSGHGWRHVGDDGERYFLIPYDVRPHELLSSALPADDFIRSLRSLRSRRLLVMIDTCHAAAMADAKDLPVESIPDGFARNPLPKSLVEKLVENLASGEGRAVFLSCGESQKSWFRPEGSLSFFTHHLICALEGAACAAGERFVKVSSLMSHVGKEVPRSAEQIGQKQTPFFKFETQDFPVALIRGGKGMPTGDKWQIPELIPYLPNRRDQRDELDKALRRWKENRTRPLVCLVVGDELQAQDMFSKRLLKEDLPKLLKLDDYLGVKEYHLGCREAYPGREGFEKQLLRDLAEGVLDDSSASKEDINQAFTKILNPILVHAHVWSAKYGRDAGAWVEGFLDFWGKWPDLSIDKPLLIVLFVKYLRKRTSWLDKRRLKTMIHIFEGYEAAPPGRLTCLNLPELKGVGQTEVEHWARADAAPFCRVQQLITEIRRLFERQDSATIPMESLATALTGMLYKLNTM